VAESVEVKHEWRYNSTESVEVKHEWRYNSTPLIRLHGVGMAKTFNWSRKCDECRLRFLNLEYRRDD